MILYLDSLIINRSLSPRNPRALKEDIRSKSPAYQMPSKVDITKYSLASYAVYPWSHVLIKYEIADSTEQDIKDFDDFVLNIFPKAQILHQRSDSQEDYLESVKILDAIPDNWIFYTPNNDQPMLISRESDVAYIDRLIKKAEAFSSKHPFVSIAYSTWTTYLNALDPSYSYFGKGAKKIDEDADSFTVEFAKGDYSSIQIVNKNLFRDWFSGDNLKGQRIFRAEDLGGLRDKEQVEVIPKKEICAHFDQYEHMLGYSNEIWNDQIPPLIIPKGFFDNNIRIAYGYNDYRPGWTNINPAAKNYSFRDIRHGTDLKIGLDDIPLFWKPRIKELDINPQMDKNMMDSAIKRNLEIVSHPWKWRNQGWHFRTLLFHLKRMFIPFRPWLVKFSILK